MNFKFKNIKRFILVLLLFPIFPIFCESVFKLDKAKDSVLIASGIILSGSDLLLDNCLKVNRQEFDGRSYQRKNVNSFDRFFMHKYSKTKDNLADCTLTISMIVPALLFIPQNEPFTKNDYLTATIMYAETLLIANGIKELTKLCVNRIRPYMYYSDLSDSALQKYINRGDFANSFPSGHSTMAFAGATFVSYTFSEYFPNSKMKIPVIIGSYGFALSTALLRVSSGNHFPTDILTGAVLGSSIGFLVPFLHKFNEEKSFNIELSSTSFSVKKWF